MTEQEKTRAAFIAGYRHALKHGRRELSARQVETLHPEYNVNEIGAFGNATLDCSLHDDYRYALALGAVGIPACEV